MSICSNMPKSSPLLRDTGCLFVTSAVESVHDHTLSRLSDSEDRPYGVYELRAMAEAIAGAARTYCNGPGCLDKAVPATWLVAKRRVRIRLAAGERRIRTLGPPVEDSIFSRPPRNPATEKPAR